jgi:hypothetical protein
MWRKERSPFQTCLDGCRVGDFHMKPHPGFLELREWHGDPYLLWPSLFWCNTYSLGSLARVPDFNVLPCLVRIMSKDSCNFDRFLLDKLACLYPSPISILARLDYSVRQASYTLDHNPVR